MCAGAGGTFNRKAVFISVVQTHTFIYVAQSDAGEALRIFLLDGTGVKTAAGIGDMNGKQILAHGGTDGDGDKIVLLPEPVEPTKATVSRGLTWNDTPCKTHSPGM